jgi:hypothetical protein
MVRSKTAAQIVSLYVGLWWTSNGVAVFVSQGGFGENLHGSVNVLGLHTAANGWHGMFHLATGLVGVAVFFRAEAARAYLFAVGSLYLLVAGWGLTGGQAILGVMAVDTVGSLVHAGEGLTALAAAWLPSRPRALQAGSGHYA